MSITHSPPVGPLVESTDYLAAHLITEGSVAGVVPIGGIIMWSGTIATVPTHWAFCDGTANSPGPDLRDQFVVGARQDSAGVAKTNIEGSLKVSATQTGATVADHTALTHDGAVASHPDLTHAALSHPALTVAHADHSLASASHTHASGADVSLPSGSFASTAGVSYPSHSHASGVDISIASITGASAAGVSSFATSTNRSGLTALPSHSHAAATASRPSITGASGANASGPSGTVAAATGSRPSLTGSDAAVTATHADHSLASLTHGAIGTHANLSHAFTPPAAHGTAGTLTHSTVAIVPAYYALAFIQRMS